MRVEQIGVCTLYQGDCRDILPTLEKVDAVIADPPYGIGFKYNSHDDDPKEYEEFMRSVVSECLRLCDGPQFWFQGMPQCRNWHKWFPEEYRQMAAIKTFVQMRPGRVQWAHDPVIFWEGNKNIDDRLRDFIVASSEFHLGRIDHPCPRPLAHMMQLTSAVRGTVLDPFMGSGQTGVGCIKNGRSFIGIEIDPHYFDVACARLEEAQRQSDLFVALPAEQVAMDL